MNTTPIPAVEGLEDLVLICGLSSDGLREMYHWVDFGRKELRLQEVDISAQRERQRAALQTGLGDTLPYGVDSVDALLPYFLHPHSFVVTDDEQVIVSFKQAPYFRILDAGGGRLYPQDADYTEMFSSTNCQPDPGIVAFTKVRASDRYARYTGGEQLFGGAIHALDLASDTEQTVAELPPFIRDTLHQIAYSPAGFYVGVDMSLDVADNGLAGMAGGFDLDVYSAAHFPESGFAVFDTARGATVIAQPGTACAAHVVIDPGEPSVFYVSCHNISKWTNQVIVHGGGSLEKYRYFNGEITHLGTFQDPGYLRVTSLELFEYDGRLLAATCSFPNQLYLIDLETMTVFDRLTLFGAPEPKPPFACEKNTPAPLYLAVSSDGEHLVLSGATIIYVVHLPTREIVLTMPFAEPGSFAATAHIGLAPQPTTA